MDRILVIDSEPGTRAALVQAIQALGEIEQVGNGVDALRLLANKKFAIVLLDLHVRPLDGFVILRTLAARGGPNKDTPVYAIAADLAEQTRALAEHAVFALTKPVNLATVVNLVDAGLRKAADESAAAAVKKSTIPPPRGRTTAPPDTSRSTTPPQRPSPTPPHNSHKPSPLPPTPTPTVPAPSPSRPGLGSEKP